MIRHTCDNPSCVNPSHLVISTHLDNARDRVERGRGAFGVNQGCAKLKNADILEIRKMLSDGVAQRRIAERFSVAQSQIGAVKRGKTWSHV